VSGMFSDSFCTCMRIFQLIVSYAVGAPYSDSAGMCQAGGAPDSL